MPSFPKKVAFHTLGCRVNQNEADAMMALFEGEGYQVVGFDEVADVYVIHTCTVTGISERKSRQIVRQAVRRNPEAVVAVSGCYAQVSPEKAAAIPGVRVVVGTGERRMLPELVRNAAETGKVLTLVRPLEKGEIFEELPLPKGTRTRAFLKVQEGCRQYCTYCIVPLARGPVRSLMPEKVLAEARRLVDAGYREVVLTGVHLGSYGEDFPGHRPNLNDLLHLLAEVKGLARLRLSSLDPNEIDTGLLDTIASLAVLCPYLHLPLQSGDDTVLRRMHRRYTANQFADLVSTLRERLPDIALGADVMVGFPGETEEQFNRTCELVEAAELSFLHVFKYSPRTGTPAAAYPDQVPARVKDRRSQQLLEVGKKLRIGYTGKFLGLVFEVLVEEIVIPAPTDRASAWHGSCDQGVGFLTASDNPVEAGLSTWEGYTANYLRVAFPGPPDLRGQLVPVRLSSMEPTGLILGCLEIVNGSEYRRPD